MVVEIKYPATTKKFQVSNWLVFFSTNSNSSIILYRCVLPMMYYLFFVYKERCFGGNHHSKTYNPNFSVVSQIKRYLVCNSTKTNKLGVYDVTINDGII